MVNDLIPGQEVKIRARQMFDAAGKKILFTGILVANNGMTMDAYVTFNGITLDVRGIPSFMVAATDAGDLVDGESENLEEA